MRWSRRFMAAFERVAIPKITVYLIAFQAMCLLLIMGEPQARFAGKLVFSPGAVLAGEWWRAITFLFMPPSLELIWAIFGWYFFWLMGTALEAHWGTARYNLYLLIAAVMTIGSAFLPLAVGLGDGIGTNYYIGETVFLAFATLYPDFVIYIFFILPVRVKWLALLTWILLGYQFVMGSWVDRAMVVAAIANYLIFFGREIVHRFRHGAKQMRRQVRRVASSGPVATGEAMHRCCVCGATEKTHPAYEFRYCTECGGKCYCMEHLRGHEHRLAK